MEESVILQNPTINENNIIIIKNGKQMKVAQLRKHRLLHMFRQKFTLNAAIGELWGTTFEVKNGQLFKIDNILSLELEKDKGIDNRFLVDDGKSQKLSKDAIENLKKQGVTGQEMVEQLIENSSSFTKKTEYAQAKYIKKKEQKYMTYVTLLKPNARLLCEIAYNKGPLKICNLRLDSLAQILTLTNVRARTRFLVVESCQGLVIGSVMERMAGEGTIIQLFHGDIPVRPILNEFDFPAEFEPVLLSYPLSKLGSLLDVKSMNICEDLMEQDSTVEEIVVTKENSAEKEDDANSEKEAKQKKRQKPEEDEEKIKRRLKRLAEYEQARQLLLQKNFDGLIIASKFYPSDMANYLIDFLAPSRPVAIFCQYKEPLMDCYVKLREKGGVINLNLTETWFRHIQILPNRSHPEINMSGSGGYLLSGIYVAS